MKGKIFLSHTVGSDIADVRNTLRQYEFLNDGFMAGDMLSIAVMNAIEECDIFIAIVDESQKSSAAIFESGIAFAKDKMVIILSDQDRIPYYPHLDRYLTIKRKDMDLLEIAVNRLLKRKFDESYLISEGFELNKDKNNNLIYISGNQVEKEFYNILKNSGSNHQIIEQSRSDSKEWIPDFAVWIDGIDDAIGNPMLFEIKADLNVEQALKLRDRVNKSTKRQTLRNLIVVYNTGSSGKILNQEAGNINISFIQLSVLKEEVDKIGLSKTIIRAFLKSY